MAKIPFYLQYALRSLRRGGQRTVLAMACIAFGVMSLVALQAVAEMFHESLFPDGAVLAGGDADLSWSGGVQRMSATAGMRPPVEPFGAAQLEQLDRFKTDGLITAYTLSADRRAAVLKPEGANRVAFISRAMGVDSNYPLVGTLQIQGQGGDPRAALASALRAPGSAAITRDLAEQLNLHTGSRFTLARDSGQVSPALQVAAIIDAIPDRRGSTVLYSLETARQIAGVPEVISDAAVTFGRAGAEQALVAAGWNVVTHDQLRRGLEQTGVFQVFDFMLKGAGILGLLIGGIGVANTMQVLLARRTLEIAVLKTHGYGGRDLLGLFAVETMLLGLFGSLLGAAAALALATPLLRLVQAFISDAGPWQIDPLVLGGGVLAGIATTLIFGLDAVVRASSVRPAVLLRSLPEKRDWNSQLKTLGIYSLLALSFLALASLIMKSVLLGAAVIAGAVVGLIGLGIVFGAILFVVLRLPVPAQSLLSLARNSMRRQLPRTLLALIALFCGVFAIGFGASATLSAVQRAMERQIAGAGDNLWTYGRPADDAAIRAALLQQGLQSLHVDYRTPIQVRAGSDVVNLALLGTDAGHYTDDFQLEQVAVWDSSPDAAYLPLAFKAAPWSLKTGDVLKIVTQDRVTHELRVAGFYSSAESKSLRITPPQGIVMNDETVKEWAGSAALVEYAGQVPTSQLIPDTDALVRALPQAIVFSNADAAAYLNKFYWELVDLVYGVAGLALIAGAVLIANAVGLALVERRRELGILKAVGFTSGKVLQTILLENGMIGLIAGALGMCAVAIVVPVVNQLQPSLRMGLHPDLVATMIAAAVLFALGSAALAAWEPTHVRPMEVLRSE